MPIAPSPGPAGPQITAAMLARSHGVADPRWSPGGTHISWVDSFDGRADVWVARADGSEPPVLVTADTGASSYCWAGDDRLVVGAADGRLVVLSSSGRVLRTLTRDGRAFGPAVSANGEVAFSLERDDACDLALVSVAGDAWPVRLSHASYAWDPSWSPDGDVLAWHEWDLPDMPWDASRIALHDRNEGTTRAIGGGDDVGVSQPRFSPDGSRVAWVSDAAGTANLWVANADGTDALPFLSEPHEHAEPSWGPGQRSYAWSPDSSEIAWCRNEGGFARLVVGVSGKRSARELSKGWHRGLDWHPNGIVCVRSGAVTPDQVVVLQANGSGRRAIARGPVGGFERDVLVEPRAITWKAQNATVHGHVYRPAGAGSARTPLLVWVHGGPTSQSVVEWNPRVQYFVARGWTVLTVDHRGSTGHGRAYLRALDGRWGERDVVDVVAGARHAVKEGWADAARVAITGGSAGGFTALLCVARHPDVFAAAAALYPVTDLLDLAETTHRFESGYQERLLGTLPDHADRYRDRSPVSLVGDIRKPVYLAHGTTDADVNPEATRAFAAALMASGTPVEFHLFEGEGHGFRRADTIADELTRRDAFLDRWVLRR